MLPTEVLGPLAAYGSTAYTAAVTSSGKAIWRGGGQPGVEEHLEMDMCDPPLVPARIHGLEGGLSVGVGELDATAEGLAGGVVSGLAHP